jgi:hypothetical protein
LPEKAISQWRTEADKARKERERKEKKEREKKEREKKGGEKKGGGRVTAVTRPVADNDAEVKITIERDNEPVVQGQKVTVEIRNSADVQFFSDVATISEPGKATIKIPVGVVKKIKEKNENENVKVVARIATESGSTNVLVTTLLASVASVNIVSGVGEGGVNIRVLNESNVPLPGAQVKCNNDQAVSTNSEGFVNCPCLSSGGEITLGVVASGYKAKQQKDKCSPSGITVNLEKESGTLGPPIILIIILSLIAVVVKYRKKIASWFKFADSQPTTQPTARYHQNDPVRDEARSGKGGYGMGEPSQGTYNDEWRQSNQFQGDAGSSKGSYGMGEPSQGAYNNEWGQSDQFQGGVGRGTPDSNFPQGMTEGQIADDPPSPDTLPEGFDYWTSIKRNDGTVSWYPAKVTVPMRDIPQPSDDRIGTEHAKKTMRGEPTTPFPPPPRIPVESADPIEPILAAYKSFARGKSISEPIYLGIVKPEQGAVILEASMSKGVNFVMFLDPLDDSHGWIFPNPTPGYTIREESVQKLFPKLTQARFSSITEKESVRPVEARKQPDRLWRVTISDQLAQAHADSQSD